MKRLVMTFLALALFITVSVGSASAALIQGSIGMVGLHTFAPGSDLLDATTISFTPPTTLLGLTGDFAQASSGTVTKYSPFLFDPFGGSFTLWTVDYLDSSSVAQQFTFTLNNLSIDLPRETDSLTLRGTGIFAATDTAFDNTPGSWILTANLSGANQTWSSSASAVPEPATMILLGAGIVGVVGSRIKRKN